MRELPHARRARRAPVLLSLAALASVAPVTSVAAAPVVATSNVHPCTDCSIAERVRPRRMRLVIAMPGGGRLTFNVRRLRWRGWGRASTTGRGRVRATYDASVRGRARIKLLRLRSHLPDGCGNRGRGRIYTRARVWISRTSDPELNGGSYVFRLPRTGCETY